MRYGLIAQEVETVLPDIVDTRSDGLKGIKYSELVDSILHKPIYYEVQKYFFTSTSNSVQE